MSKLIISCSDLRVNNWKYLVKILEKIIGGKFYEALRDVVKDKYKKISPSLYLDWNLIMVDYIVELVWMC